MLYGDLLSSSDTMTTLFVHCLEHIQLMLKLNSSVEPLVG